MHSLLLLRKFDLFRKIVDILSLVKRNFLLSPLEGEKKFLSELCELRNFREGYKKYKTLDRRTECAMTDVGEKKGKIEMNKNNLQQKQPNNPAAFPENKHSLLPDTVFSRFMSHVSPKRKSAFTLAEVLITLGVIGVVAALTLPTLVQNYKEKILINKIKRTYSNIQNAIIMAQKENESIGDNSVLFNASDGVVKVTENFAKYFNGAKVCKTKKECPNYYYNIEYANSFYNSNGETMVWDSSLPKIILNDGSVILINSLNNGCESHRFDTYYDENGQPTQVKVDQYFCASLFFDVNGSTLPNKFGQDAFYIQVFKDKVVPDKWSKTGGDTLNKILSGNEKLYSSKK